MSSKVFRTALITGASRRIGYELAKLFARDKYGLILVSRKESDLQKVKEELQSKYQSPQIQILPKDLSKANSAAELFHQIKEKHQLNIHFLINNAGSGQRGKISETDLQKDLDAIHLNIISTVTLTKLLLPEMLQRNSGRILMLGSSASFQPSPLLANYAATKAFIANYTDALNALDKPKEVARRGYDALIKGEHRAYGSTKVKVLVGLGQVIPNEIIAKTTRLVMEEKKSK